MSHLPCPPNPPAPHTRPRSIDPSRYYADPTSPGLTPEQGDEWNKHLKALRLLHRTYRAPMWFGEILTTLARELAEKAFLADFDAGLARSGGLVAEEKSATERELMFAKLAARAFGSPNGLEVPAVVSPHGFIYRRLGLDWSGDRPWELASPLPYTATGPRIIGAGSAWPMALVVDDDDDSDGAGDDGADLFSCDTASTPRTPSTDGGAA
jgi:hypothetical protein